MPLHKHRRQRFRLWEGSPQIRHYWRLEKILPIRSLSMCILENSRAPEAKRKASRICISCLLSKGERLEHTPRFFLCRQPDGRYRRIDRPFWLTEKKTETPARKT